MRISLIETLPSLLLAVLLASAPALAGSGCDKTRGANDPDAPAGKAARGKAAKGKAAKGKAAKGKAAKGKAAEGEPLVDDPQRAAKTWLPSAASSKTAARYALQSPPKTFDRENVFDLLNGGADQLIEQGLRSVLYVRVHDTAKKAANYEIQLWDMSSPAKARAMLAREKAPEAKPLSLGDAAWAEPGAVLLVKGRHLVRVTAQPAGDRAEAPVQEVARRILATAGARW